MIRFENITLKIQQQTLLDETSLHLKPGDKLVLRGPSGCGKSSLLKAAVGALPINSGRILFDGIELNAQNVADIRSRVSFIGQEPVLGAERVLEALMLPFRYKAHRSRTVTGKQIAELLERLRLSTDILDKPSARISGGEKQRIAIARALLLDKSIFIADEITSALDPESKEAVMAELFRPGITVLSVSHDPDWTEACTRRIKIENHRLVESGAEPQTTLNTAVPGEVS
ncbi:ATP-binding cassette domain-containing protein [Pontiella sp.]|uniref:ABC transporter ATP-binding protein n=1 Tax=Pontiella sp. TaxID=2837462 RepID=UPI00356AC1C0